MPLSPTIRPPARMPVATQNRMVPRDRPLSHRARTTIRSAAIPTSSGGEKGSALLRLNKRLWIMVSLRRSV